MELAHLVRAVIPSGRRGRAWRLVARFFVAGAVLLATRRAVWPEGAQARPLPVAVPGAASSAEVAALVDEAILVDVATDAGWARSDAVVRERLLASLAVVESVGADPNAAVDRAIALGLHRSDVVARRRLAAEARRSIERSAPDPPPSLDEVSAEIAAHPERYRVPSRVRFRQVFLSAARRGASLDEGAAAVLARLRAAPETPPEALAALSDPWPWGGASGATSTDRLDAIYGDGFGRALERAELRAWIGPVRSGFGVHLVRVDERDEGRVQSPREAFGRASEEIRSERRNERFEARMRDLRRRYRVLVERTP